MRPLVSVVLPNYNNARWLEKALRSVAAQSYPEIEIVVVDDASTDHSRDLLDELRGRLDRPWQILHNRENLGVTVARHQGLEASRGHYLTTLDPDDFFWDSEKIAREVAVVEEAEGRAAGFSDIIWVDEEDREIFRAAHEYSVAEGWIEDALLTRSCLIPRDYVIERSLYFEVDGFDLSLTHFEDWDLKLRLARKIPFRYTGGAGTAYRQHAISIRRVHAEALLRWQRYVFAKNTLHRSADYEQLYAQARHFLHPRRSLSRRLREALRRRLHRDA